MHLAGWRCTPSDIISNIVGVGVGSPAAVALVVVTAAVAIATAYEYVLCSYEHEHILIHFLIASLSLFIRHLPLFFLVHFVTLEGR